MLKELKFVQGAVGKKEFIPAMTHFCIENGTVRAYNGTLALSTPIACDLACKPKAVPMVQAIVKCQDTITMHMTPGGKLSIKSGSFKALVECVEETQIHVQPEGQEIKFDGQALIKGLKTIYPFIGKDAARPWGMGVLLDGKSAYATNNVCLVEYWIGVDFPIRVNIPRAAIAELIRVDDYPTHGQITENSISFHYPDGKWLRTQLYETNWPDVAKILDTTSCPQAIPEEFYTALDSLKPFTNPQGEVFMKQEFFHTHHDIMEGASYDINFVPVDSLYSLEMLQLLKGVATHADFSAYPQPCMFFGENLRGAVIGRKM